MYNIHVTIKDKITVYITMITIYQLCLTPHHIIILTSVCVCHNDFYYHYNNNIFHRKK